MIKKPSKFQNQPGELTSISSLEIKTSKHLSAISDFFPDSDCIHIVVSMIILLAILSGSMYQILGDVIIGNGNVVLGISENAALNVPYVGNILGFPASDPLDIDYVGLRTNDGQYASTEPGCLCEGWGVAVPSYGYTTYANQANSGSFVHHVSETGSNGGSTAVIVVESVDGNIRVTHSYEPSDSMCAMKGLVTIQNIGTNNFDQTIYRRVMDWDITPTHFNEYVTIIGTDADDLIYSSNNGFCSSDPLYSCSEIYPNGTTNVDFIDKGPADHGAIFDFDFGPLGPEEEINFNIFYGVAPGESTALQALNSIGAEVASLGQNSNDPAEGSPHTFFFGFSGVGGDVIGMTISYCNM